MFQKEFQYWGIGIVLTVLVCILSVPLGLPILLFTWAACRSYHQQRINALIRWGPENVLGMFYKSTYDYNVWLRFLAENLKDLDKPMNKDDSTHDNND